MHHIEFEGSDIRELSREMRKIKCSIIIPTKNRDKTLQGTLLELSKCTEIENTELILCNDGSVDDTAVVVQEFIKANPNILVTFYDDGHRGVAFQRNRAAESALGQILIFSADDIRPLSKSWIVDHVRLHILQPTNDFAVIGKMTWPSSNLLPTNAVMATVQGRGGEQFGYADLQANTYVDWRFFYTSNLSVKKSLVSNWLTGGFSLDFPEINFEDIEFAYRLHTGGRLRLFYSNVPTGLHFQDMKVSQFCTRQRTAGRMAVKFVQIHPELGQLLTPASGNIGDPKNISIILRLIDGLQAYVEWLELTGYLGTEEWHIDLLHSLFHIYFRLGVLDEVSGLDSSRLCNELEALLRQNLSNLGRNIGFTVLGDTVNFDPSSKSRVRKKLKRNRYKVGPFTVSLSPESIHRVVNNKRLLRIVMWLRYKNFMKKTK
jgi:glycosyltransferase involved in cell wall biosynthesis